MKFKLFVLCLVLAALGSAAALPAGAQQRRGMDSSQIAQDRPVQDQSAPARPDPRDKVAACHKEARDKKLEGEARKSFMTSCGGRKAQTTAPRQKAKSCAEQAKARKLGSDGHKEFVAKCMGDGA